MKKPRNKKYQQPATRSLTGSLSAIISNRRKANPLPAERQANVVIAYHTSIDALTGGYAEKNHFDTIVYALNIGSILAANGLGAEYTDLLDPAKNAMQRCKDRYLQSGKFGLDGDGLQAIREVAGLHEAQVALATQGELEAAIGYMHQQLEGKSKGAAA